MEEKDLMNVFSDNFKRLRKTRKLLQKDVAALLDVSTSTVSDWENGEKMPRAGAIQKISELFEVQKNELFTEWGTTFPTVGEMIRIPIVGRISCGNGTLAYEEIEGYEATPKEWLTSGEHLYLRAKGDSMIGARIYDGDLLLIRMQPEVENGEIAAVLINDNEEAVLKRVYMNGGQLVLQSENPQYPPIFAPPENVRIIGKLKLNVIKF